jgi:hypothetical protein
VASNKKVEIKKSVDDAVLTAPDTEANAPKIVAEVLAQADASVLVKDIPADFTSDLSGEAKRDPANNRKHIPQDSIPGTKPLDALHVPEHAYDDDRHVVRRVTLPQEYHYIWVEGTDIDRFKHNGYKFVLYNGGPQSGLAEQGLSGTYLYDRTLDNHVRRGDVYLMYCSIRRYEEIVREDEERAHNMRNMGHNNFHNISYKYGIRSFHEMNPDARAPKEHVDETKLLYN